MSKNSYYSKGQKRRNIRMQAIAKNKKKQKTNTVPHPLSHHW